MKINLHETPYVPVYKRVSCFYIPALFVITTVLLDVIMYINMHWSFPPAYIFSLSIVLLIAALVSLCRYKWLQTVLCSLLLGWQLTTTISNIIAQDTCMEIFSLETLKSIIMAFGNADSVILNLWFLVPIVLLVVAYVVMVVLVMWFCRTPRAYHRSNRQAFLCGALAFMSFFSYTLAYSCSPSYRKGSEYYVANLSNQKFLYDTFGNRVSSLRTFGSYSYYIDNLLYLLGGKTDATKALKLTVDDFTANEFALSEDEVLDEGYNLIMVLMETFEREAINKYTMPNLYEFMQQSCVDVNGYYSMERTCFTDYIGQTGMHALGEEWWSNYGDVAVPHSLANIFNRSHYVTASFHDTNGTVYNRNKYFKSAFGFQSFNNYDTYDNPRYTEPEHFGLNPDELLFKANLDKIAPSDQNFYSYVIGVSTHAVNPKFHFNEYPEYQDGVQCIQKNWVELTEMYPVLLSQDADAVQMALNYLLGGYSFDQGFGALIDHLKTTRNKKGELLIEKTAIVMFGDHYYYVNPDVLKPENDDPRGLVGNRCPFIVYNPRQVVDAQTGMTQADNAKLDKPANCGVVMNRFTSTMDIYPTVCSLFGIVTDQQLTYGHSIFDPADSLGVGYLNSFTWGATGYDEKTDTWQIWRTLNFVDFDGEQLSAAQIKAVTPLVNRTYASIYLNMSLFRSNGFKDLEKAFYQLGSVKNPE